MQTNPTDMKLAFPGYKFKRKVVSGFAIGALRFESSQMFFINLSDAVVKRKPCRPNSMADGKGIRRHGSLAMIG
jgi:hypothetical protein